MIVTCNYNNNQMTVQYYNTIALESRALGLRSGSTAVLRARALTAHAQVLLLGLGGVVVARWLSASHDRFADVDGSRVGARYVEHGLEQKLFLERGMGTGTEEHHYSMLQYRIKQPFTFIDRILARSNNSIPQLQ